MIDDADSESQFRDDSFFTAFSTFVFTFIKFMYTLLDSFYFDYIEQIYLCSFAFTARLEGSL